MIIDVLGLGESLSVYKPSDNISIGVNDIYKYHKTDLIVIADPPSKFTEVDRYQTIIESVDAKAIYSPFLKWKALLPKYVFMQLALGRGTLTQLDEEDIFCYSNNSAFMAVVLAYKLGATQINLYGADFNSHATLSTMQCRERILNDFSNLNKEFVKHGVELRVTKQSILSEILQPILG